MKHIYKTMGKTEMSPEKLYKKNIEYLRGRNKQGKDSFKKLAFPPENIAFFKTKTGGVSARIKSAGGEEYLLSSGICPETEAAGFLDSIEEDVNIFVIIGLGTGAILKKIMDARKDPFVLVIEPLTAVYQSFLAATDITGGRYDGVIFAIGAPEKTVPHYTSIFAHTILYTTKKFSVYRHPNLTAHFPEHEKAAVLFRDTLRSVRANLMTGVGFRDLHFRNSAANLKYWVRCPGVNIFKDRFKNKPAIAIASGPTLDDSMPYIRRCKGKALIICAATSLKPLLAAGVKPDVVASIDPQPLSMEQFRDADISGIYLLASATSVPEVVRLFGKRTIFFEQGGGSWQKNISAKKSIPVSGTVATAVLSFAVHCGCNPVIMTGFDLSYDGKKHHVSGTFFEKVRTKLNVWEENYEKIEKKLMEIDGNYGRKVKTDTVFYSYLSFIKKYVKAQSQRGVTFVNATTGGALIENAVLTDFPSALKEYIPKKRPAETPAGVIRKTIKTKFNPNREAIHRRILRIQKAIENVEQLTAEGISLCNSALFEFKAGRVPDSLEKLDIIDKKILKNRDIQKMMSAKTMMPAMSAQFWNNSEDRCPEDLIRRNRALYENMFIGCKEFRKEIDYARAAIIAKGGLNAKPGTAGEDVPENQDRVGIA